MSITNNAQKSFRFVAIFFVLISITIYSWGQGTFDVNFQNITFRNANKIHKVGANGSAAGNVTLYTNIITIGGQQIDCIVRTVSLTNGTFQLPGSAAAGTIPFDYSSATGTGMSDNNDDFFSPTFSFNTGGGSCRFRFEFILGGSYNDGTNTGTAVDLQNVYLNSYDIDGNGGAGSNQFNEFNSLSSYSLGAGSTVGVSYNNTSRLTRFLSSISSNSTSVTSQGTRIRLTFNTVSTIDVVVGAQGSGQAFFFLDLSIGAAVWTPTTVVRPALDLNTSADGFNNTGSTCTLAADISSGSANYTNTAGSINVIRTDFSSASILNGNDETLVINGSTSPVNAAIQLGFTSSASSTFVLAGATFLAQQSVSGGVSTIVFTNNAGGALTNIQTEALIDALEYKHNSATPTAGLRELQFTIQDGVFNSNAASYAVNVSCGTLPVTWIYFNGQAFATSTELTWATEREYNNAYFEVEKSTDAINYQVIGRVMPGQSNTNEYRFSDLQHVRGISYYRLKQVDANGVFKYSSVVRVSHTGSDVIKFYTNNSSGRLFISIPSDIQGKIQISLYDVNGRMMLRKPLSKGTNDLNIGNLSTLGIYTLVIQNERAVLFTGRFLK
jgi:hypothetical protein